MNTNTELMIAGDLEGATALLEEQSKDASSREAMEAFFKAAPVIVTPKAGELIDGMVLARKGPYLYVDLGSYGTGIIYGREYYNARDLIKPLKAGDPLTAKVVESENAEGYTELSLREAGRDRMWRDAEDLIKNKTPISLKVLSANKGGLVLSWQGMQGFLPVSQLTAKHYPRVEGGDKGKILTELQRFVDRMLEVTILDIAPKEGKLIFSEKSVESDELRETLARYEVGSTIRGEVTGVVDFGVFIKIEEGLEGLAHISELDWGLVENPADLFKVGDAVEAKIIHIEGGKISLSVKALKTDPWQAFAASCSKGDIVRGKIKKIDRFGAFVDLEKYALSGLVHVSEFGSEKAMRDTLAIGETHHFQIINISPEERKLSLSFIKEGEPAAPAQPSAEAPAEEQLKDTVAEPQEVKEAVREEIINEVKKEETAS